MAQKAAMSEVVLRYTQALYASSGNSELSTQIADELAGICDLLDENPALQRAFGSPVVSNRQRVNFCRALAERLGLNPLTKNFMCLLAKKGRLNLLQAIGKKFQEFCANSRGETKVEVTSAHLLDSEITLSLKQQLEQVTGKSVFIDNKVNKRIIAGLIIKIGSHMFDFSAQTRLRRIAHHMEGL